MAIHFFAEQQRARRRTAFMLGLFLAATGLVVLFTDAVVITALAVSEAGWMAGASKWAEVVHQHPKWLLWTTVISGSAILLASLYRVATLARGGAALMQSLGAVRVDSDSGHPQLRVLRNVEATRASAHLTPVADASAPLEAGAADAPAAVLQRLPATPRRALTTAGEFFTGSESARDPERVLELVVAVLLSRDAGKRARQIGAPHCNPRWTPVQRNRMTTLALHCKDIDVDLRWPLLELAFPALHRQPPERLSAFVQWIDNLQSENGESELLRVIAASLHCPAEPVIG